MLHIYLETPKHLTLPQRIELQKKLVSILAKKYKENPTLPNLRDLNNEVRILKLYEPEIDLDNLLKPTMGYNKTF